MRAHRTMSGAFLSLALFACGGGEDEDPGASGSGGMATGSTGGTSMTTAGSGGTSASNGGTSASNGGTNGSMGGTGGGSDMQWAGTWAASATYDVTCDNGLAPDQTDEDKTGNWTIQISGENASLEAVTSTNFIMQGNGNATSMTLNGEFPVRGTDDNIASTASDITMTISIDVMTDHDHVSGSLSGQFELTSNGAASNCTVSDGSIELSR